MGSLGDLVGSSRKEIACRIGKFLTWVSPGFMGVKQVASFYLEIAGEIYG
jgi:hypothetical protein